MPEAAVNEDDASPAGKNDVGASGQRANVKAEPVSESVQKASDDTLRARVATANSLHYGAAFLGRERVSHKLWAIPVIASVCLPL